VSGKLSPTRLKTFGTTEDQALNACDELFLHWTALTEPRPLAHFAASVAEIDANAEFKALVWRYVLESDESDVTPYRARAADRRPVIVDRHSDTN